MLMKNVINDENIMFFFSEQHQWYYNLSDFFEQIEVVLHAKWDRSGFIDILIDQSMIVSSQSINDSA